MRRKQMISMVAAGMVALLVSQVGCANTDQSAGRTGADPAYPPAVAEADATFEDYGVNPPVDTSEQTQSTFALDVDTGSYTITRGFLRQGFLPQPAAVRAEEFVNYFDQDYPSPAEGMSIHLDGTSAPFLAGADRRVLRVGLQAAVVDDADRPPANLTFIIDVSGSMRGPNLEMVQSALHRLLDTLRPDDAVAIATFASEAELALAMTPMSGKAAVRAAVDGLRPAGSTNLEAGLSVGYEHATANLRATGINRVVLLSDGEANEGQTDPGALANQIAQAAEGTSVAVIGVGRQTYDDTILEQFANRGNGFYAYIDTIREAERLFVHDLTGTLQLVAREAKVQVSFNPQTVSQFRLLGYENRQLDHDQFRDDTVDGGEVGAGHNVTAVYEVSLTEAGVSADTELATVQLRWLDPDSGEPVERAAAITAGELVEGFDQAAPRLRQSILVAAFAESLRGAPWAGQLGLAQLVSNVDVLARQLPEDSRVVEFAELVAIAADLAG